MLPAFFIGETILRMVTDLELVEHPAEEWMGCDQCPARASVEVVLPYGDLAFCNHHYNKHAIALTDQGGIARLLTINTGKNG